MDSLDDNGKDCEPVPVTVRLPTSPSRRAAAEPARPAELQSVPPPRTPWSRVRRRIWLGGPVPDVGGFEP